MHQRRLGEKGSDTLDFFPAYRRIALMITTTLLALTTAMGLPAGLAPATAAPNAIAIAQDDVTETARGSIKSVDATKKSFVIAGTGEGAKDTTVTIDDKTVYMKDGKVSTKDEVLKVGNNVTVTHKKGLASKVEALSK